MQKLLPAHQRKWGDYPPVLKVGDLSPLPPPPCSDAYADGRTDTMFSMHAVCDGTGLFFDTPHV